MSDKGMFTVDYTDTTAKFVRPELLKHPQIPRPLHGLNPRNINGREWWDKVRKEAYKENNYCCWACGAPAGSDPIRPELCGHECYDIDYEGGVSVFRGVVALCYSCHNFIHIGFLWMMNRKGKVSMDTVRHVVHSRAAMLRQAGLEPHWGVRIVELYLEGYTEDEAAAQLRKEGPPSPVPAPSHMWRLVVGDITYDRWRRKIDESGKVLAPPAEPEYSPERRDA